jgi:hypothetical protein
VMLYDGMKWVGVGLFVACRVSTLMRGWLEGLDEGCDVGR